jgi:hypothetical protein
MCRRLIEHTGARLVRIGRRVLSRLRVDPRLAEPTAALASAQTALENRVTARSEAEEAARNARDERDQAKKNAVYAVREFGLVLLATLGNNHGADDYLRYFPDGYGDILLLKPDEIISFATVILGKLTQETNPKLAAHQEPITATRDALLAAESAYQAARQAQVEAVAYLKAEKRTWARAMISARSRTQVIRYGERAYTRAIFGPAFPRRRRDAPEEEEPEETPAVPEVPSVTLPITEAAA